MKKQIKTTSSNFLKNSLKSLMILGFTIHASAGPIFSGVSAGSVSYNSNLGVVLPDGFFNTADETVTLTGIPESILSQFGRRGQYVAVNGDETNGRTNFTTPPQNFGCGNGQAVDNCFFTINLDHVQGLLSDNQAIVLLIVQTGRNNEGSARILDGVNTLYAPIVFGNENVLNYVAFGTQGLSNNAILNIIMETGTAQDKNGSLVVPFVAKVETNTLPPPPPPGSNVSSPGTLGLIATGMMLQANKMIGAQHASRFLPMLLRNPRVAVAAVVTAAGVYYINKKNNTEKK